MYIINESLSGTVLAYSILNRLRLPWEEWEAFKLGLIDSNGKLIKHAVSSKEREVWTAFDRLLWNLKKILIRFVGNSRLAHYMTAAYLLRDSLTPEMISDPKFQGRFLTGLDSSAQLKIYRMLRDIDEQCILDDKTLDIEHRFIKALPQVEEALKKKEGELLEWIQ